MKLDSFHLYLALECFLKYIKIIFFYNLFLILIHQNNLKILKIKILIKYKFNRSTKQLFN
jgi:hypothetical protein